MNRVVGAAHLGQRRAVPQQPRRACHLEQQSQHVDVTFRTEHLAGTGQLRARLTLRDLPGDAVAEHGVPAREIAEAIGRGLKIPVVSMSPEEATGHFGWLGFFAGMDMPASSALTQQRLGWRPTQKARMIDDLDHMNWSGG